MPFYVTTYCNHPHDTTTGRPIGHECYILPPSALRAERAGDYERAIDIIQAHKPLRSTRGRKRRNPSMAKRRRRLRRVRYVPRRRRGARRNPGLMSSTMLLLAGAGIAGFFIWKKMKSGAVAVTPKPAGTSVGVKIGDASVTAQIPTSGWGQAQSYGAGTLGSLGSGGLGSLS